MKHFNKNVGKGTNVSFSQNTGNNGSFNVLLMVYRT